MSRTGGSAGPTQVPGWVMRANEGIERVLLVLRVSILWLLLSLLGLGVAGVAPASAAAADAFIASRHGAKVRVLPVMWEAYRRQFVGVNLRLLPLLVVQLGSTAMIWIIIGGGTPGQVSAMVLSGLAVASLAWSLLSAAAIVAVPRLRRQELLVTWRLALLLPGALPGRSVLLILGLAVWIVLCAWLWPLALLLGAGGAIDLATAVLGRRTELLLEDLEKTAGAAA